MYDIILFLFILLPAKTLCGWVVATFLVLSSLGANAALKDFSNVTTKSFYQNGCYKLPDGLMLQWGYVASSSGMGTIYFSPSFSGTPFAISFAVQHNTTSSDYNSVHVNYTSLTSSSFGYKKGYTTPTDSEATVRPFFWFVIGKYEIK